MGYCPRLRRHKLDARQRTTILRLLKRGVGTTAIARRFAVDSSTIRKVRLRQARREAVA